MDAKTRLAIAEWLTEAGLGGVTEDRLLEGFCVRLVESGVALSRGAAGVDTLHPVLEGRFARWERTDPAVKMIEYSREEQRVEPDRWKRSPWFQLLRDGASMLRRRVPEEHVPGEFPVLDDLVPGVTDYVAMMHRFGDGAQLGQIDGVYSSWCSARPGGFAGEDLDALSNLVPVLALALKSVCTAHIAETLVETYLGRDAGRRVLRGHIERGVAAPMSAVLWLSDLKGFTRLAEEASPEQVIPLLNDYAGAVVAAVHEQGGDVLKFIGDGVLAVFGAAEPATACGCALEAAADAARRVEEVNRRRAAEGQPVTTPYVALHVGEVFYGNIGSVDRLDFTVVGPAVNEVSRISALCRQLEQDLLVSSSFAAEAGPRRAGLVSVGRYALRGVGRAQDLYTVER